MLTVNPSTFDQESDYRWDRAWNLGVQAGAVLNAVEHMSKKNTVSLKLTIGFQGPEGGVAVDAYVKPFGKQFAELLRAVAPEYLEGRPCEHCGRPAAIDPAVLINRWVFGEVENEFDEQTQKTRPRIRRFYGVGRDGHPIGVGAPQPMAAAASDGGV